MIAAARSCFSDYRFDGGTADLLAGFVIPWGLGVSAVHLVSCRHVLVHACFICPSVGIAFSFLTRVLVISPVVASLAFPSSASLGGGYVRVLVLILIISSIISCGEVGRSCRHRVLLHLIGVLSSHRWRLSCGGRRTLPLISPCVSFLLSWGKRRGIRFLAHRHLMPSGFSFLVSPCRLVGRLVPYLSS